MRVVISNFFQGQVLEGLKECDNVITGDASALEKTDGNGGGNRGPRQ